MRHNEHVETSILTLYRVLFVLMTN